MSHNILYTVEHQKEVVKMRGVSIYLEDDEYYTLKRMATRMGKSLSSYAREKVLQAMYRERDMIAEDNLIVFDFNTLMGIFNLTTDEVAKELKRGRWNITRNDETHMILAYAIAYAQKKHRPVGTREIGIFATVVAGFTTGLWSGFGQEQDPLYTKAQKAIIELVGGRAVGEVNFMPVLTQKDRVYLTKEGIRRLEELLFKK